MSFIDATISFPIGRLELGFVQTYLARYTDPETGWGAAHWDDSEHTTRRRASLFDGTIAPTPQYDAPIPEDFSEFTDEWKAAHLIGHTISLGWPEAFISDLQRDPQPEPELFDGIAISPVEQP